MRGYGAQRIVGTKAMSSADIMRDGSDLGVAFISVMTNITGPAYHNLIMSTVYMQYASRPDVWLMIMTIDKVIYNNYNHRSPNSCKLIIFCELDFQNNLGTFVQLFLKSRTPE